MNMFTMEKMQNVENPLTQIVNGIIVFLQSGEYKDTTGIAFKNQSVESKDRVPQNISVDNDDNYVSANGDGADYVSENKELNCNKHMNKKLMMVKRGDGSFGAPSNNNEQQAYEPLEIE